MQHHSFFRNLPPNNSSLVHFFAGSLPSSAKSEGKHSIHIHIHNNEKWPDSALSGEREPRQLFFFFNRPFSKMATENLNKSKLKTYTSTRNNIFTLLTMQSFSISGVTSAEKL